MNKHEVIERLLKAANSKQWNASAVFGGAAGMGGSLNVLPADMNKAIQAWLESGNAQGIQQITNTLHAVGNLTDTEHEQIMEAIDGEK